MTFVEAKTARSSGALRALARHGEKPYIGMYHTQDCISRYYEFHAGIRDHFNSSIMELGWGNGPGHLFSIKPVPAVWRNGIELFLDGEYQKKLGYVNIEIVKKRTFGMVLAVISQYYPREWLGKGFGRKLPYFMEAMMVHHLRREGFTHIRTIGPLDDRLNQLRNVGLRADPMPIDEYLKGLARGIWASNNDEFRLSTTVSSSDALGWFRPV